VSTSAEHFSGQLWLTDRDADLVLIESEELTVYVVHVDDRGITYESSSYRFFSPWSAVLSISVRV